MEYKNTHFLSLSPQIHRQIHTHTHTHTHTKTEINMIEDYIWDHRVLNFFLTHIHVTTPHPFL